MLLRLAIVVEPWLEVSQQLLLEFPVDHFELLLPPRVGFDVVCLAVFLHDAIAGASVVQCHACRNVFHLEKLEFFGQLEVDYQLPSIADVTCVLE